MFPVVKFHNKSSMHLLTISNPEYNKSIILHVEDCIVLGNARSHTRLSDFHSHLSTLKTGLY